MKASPACLARIARISWREILEDGADLIEEYTQECADPAFLEVRPSQLAYAALEQAGVLHCFGVYADDFLAGFATILTSVLPHYSQQISVVESLFVSSRYRSRGLGTELIKAIEAFARDSGSVGVLYSVRPKSRLERLFEMKNYLRTSAVFYRSV